MAGAKPRMPILEPSHTMNPKQIMHRWSAFLQTLLPQTHLYQVVALAAFSFALTQARHPHLSRLSAHVPTPALPASALRRLKRLLHNPRLDVEAVCDQMAGWLGRWNRPDARLLLLLDETPHHNTWRVVKISVCYRKRALPLVWRTTPLRGRDQVGRVMEVLEHAARLCALYCPQAKVTLLADRGLCWPDLIDFCTGNNWHYVLRAQSQTRFVPQGTPRTQARPLGQLVSAPGQWWCGQGEAFAKAGWRSVSVVALWRAHAKEQWLLVSDLQPSLHLCRWYARRMWHEQSFRDEKSHGFCWQESRLQKVEAVHRLLLVLALAQLWLMRLGTLALGEWREVLGLTSHLARQRFSVCRHGWHLLRWCLHNAKHPPCNLDFLPP